MKILQFLGLALACLTWTAKASVTLPRCAPEAQGVSSAALIEFVNALDHIDGMHGVMVVRHGQVIAEGWWAPYAAKSPHVLYSLSKSFTSTAVGFAVAEGKLSIDDPVLKFFPDDAPATPSDNLKAMRVRDLLTMSAGHQDESPRGPQEVCAKTFLAQPVPHAPGTHFMYNTPATFMLSAIVQKVTGETVRDYLEPRLFEPLGIEQPVWDKNFQGICLGGYGLRVHTEDLAKFGQFYLQQGTWQGKQLLPAEWVTMATSRQTANGSNPDSDWNQGYGFQFWRCRHHAYRGDGAFGQYCVVLPDHDAVVAINSGVSDMQAVLNVIWDKLLPSFHAAALPADDQAADELAGRLSHLEVAPPAGAATGSISQKIWARKFTFPDNTAKIESVEFAAPGNGGVITLKIRMDGKDFAIPAGYRDWQKSRAPLDAGELAQFPDEPVAATFAWTAGDTFSVKVCAVETPYQQTFTFQFADGHLTMDSELNVSFDDVKKARLVGAPQ